jgi:hypothetical protein
MTIDTGSSVLWVNGPSCPETTCGNAKGFDPSLSNSLRRTNNTFTTFYGGGTSNNGTWVQDTVRIGPHTLDIHSFGVVDSSSVLGLSVDSRSSGIVDFGWPNSRDGPSLPYNLAGGDWWSEPQFGIYLARNENWGRANSFESRLTLG